MAGLPGEKEKVELALKIGAEIGFGNLIAHLKRAWALSQEEKYGIAFEQNPIAEWNGTPYPKNCYLFTEEDTKELLKGRVNERSISN